ncbi:MAG: beta-N-acetylhexosaminidase [Alistipes sp.]|nr:beta-N-acetylhexosaminidase [Alistipes sp.]
MRFRLLFAIVAMTISATLVSASQPALIPTPKKYVAIEGSFALNSRSSISANSQELQPAAQYLASYLGTNIVNGNGAISLEIDPSLKGEAYKLEVTIDRVVIRGGSYGGVFSAITTFMQLLPASVYGKMELPTNVACCKIEDAPRFEYRGFMLDVCRTWMSKEAVMSFIDLLAFHKINKLRLHLTDDEAWRLEIKSHPELATVGGFRGGDSPVWPRYGKWDEKWGGYYTQSDMREIIDYAKVRNIEVIPEIDLPGHSLAMASIHPEILCNYKPNLNASFGYDTRSAFCAAKESNYELLHDILVEVCTLFDTKYIHIGGDEVETSQWKSCPDCKVLMASKGYTSPEQLQAYFMTRLSGVLEECGKHPAVWNEAIDGGQLNKNTVVFGWMGVKECRTAAAKGYKTVVMPGQYFYFDMKQSKREPGHDWAAVFDWTKVYGVTPTALGFTDTEQHNIWGYEASFFSEAYASRNPERADYLHYQTFPRIVALAEIAWNSSDERNKDKFYKRMVAHYDRLDAMGVAYRLMPPVVSYTEGRLTAKCDDGSEIYVKDELTGKEYRYTAPIATSKPAAYGFVARRAKASSPEAGHESHFKNIYPQFTITSSMPESETMTFAKAQNYGRLARTSRSCKEGDWIQFTFAKAVDCRRMQVATGNFQLPRFIFEEGYAEISYNGTDFHYAGKMGNGIFVIHHPIHPIKAIRLVCTSEGNGAKFVSIQPPTIWPTL